jgi:hypothetical protein
MPLFPAISLIPCHSPCGRLGRSNKSYPIFFNILEHIRMPKKRKREQQNQQTRCSRQMSIPLQQPVVFDCWPVFWTVQEKPLRAAQKLFLGGKKRVSRFFNWICLKIGYLIIVQIFFSIRVDLTYVIEKSAPKWPLMPLITIDACQMAGRKNHPPIQER